MPIHETEHSVELTPNTLTKRCVIWCHGLGADGYDFVPLAQELNLPETHAARFVFPHAPLMPVTFNQGMVMRAWFDIIDVRIDAKVDEIGVNQSKQRLHELLEKELASGIPAKHLYVGGFSQGAVMALTTGLAFSQPLGGIIALSGFLPHPDRFLKLANPAQQNTPIFLGHGRNDDIVPYHLGEESQGVLSKAGYAVTWKPYSMGHSVCPDEINDIRHWLLSH
jgi:phospholipase/carboxylesterase